MDTVSIRDLRTRAGDVVDRVQAGERFLVARDGRPVAELRPLAPPSLGAAELVRRRSHLPAVDPAAFRRELDEMIEPEL